MNLEYSSLTHTGMKRTQNQDKVFTDLNDGFFIIADGMGGHFGGEIASQMAVEAVSQHLKNNNTKHLNLTKKGSILEFAIHKANENIYNKGIAEKQYSGMGTTLSILWLSNIDNKWAACIGQVGDSRIYYIHDFKIWQLTRDHSLIQERLRAGLITRDALKTEKNKNVLTRAVGYEKNLESDIFWFEPQPGGFFVICSDGLHGLVNDEKIKQIVTEGANINQISEKLVNEANSNGGNDNVSVIVVKVPMENS